MDVTQRVFVNQFKDQLDKEIHLTGADVDIDIASSSLIESFTPEERFSSSQWFNEWFNTSQNVVLMIGEGGSGKSTLLKKILLAQADVFLSGNSEYIPLFAPLHELSGGIKTLPDYLVRNFQHKVPSNMLLRSGKWLIGLDGITELKNAENDLDPAVVIKEFVESYPNSRFVLTSRSTSSLIDTFSSFADIKTIQPFTWEQLRDFMVSRLGRRGFESLLSSQNFLGSNETILYNPLFATMATEVYSISGNLALTQGELFKYFIDLQLKSPAFRVAGSWSNNPEKIYSSLENMAVTLLREGSPLLFSKDKLNRALEHIAQGNYELLSDLTKAVAALSATGIFIKTGGTDLLRWRHQKFFEYLVATRMQKDYFKDHRLNESGVQLLKEIFHHEIMPSDLRSRLWKESVLMLISIIRDLNEADDLMKKIFLDDQCNPMICYDAFKLLDIDLRSIYRDIVVDRIFELAVSDIPPDSIYMRITTRLRALSALWNLSAWKICIHAVDNLLKQLHQSNAKDVEALLLIMRGRQIYELDAGWGIVLDSYRDAKRKSVDSGNVYLRKVCEHNIALHEAFDFNQFDPEPVFKVVAEYFKFERRSYEHGCVENNLGILFLRRCEWTKSESYFNNALLSFEHYPLENAQVRMNKALMQFCSGRFTEAEKELESLYDVFQMISHKQGLCYTKLNLSVLYTRLYFEQGDQKHLQSAYQCIQQAYKVNEETNEVWTLATLLQLEALLLLKQGQLKDAEEKLRQALEFMSNENLAEYVGSALVRANLARAIWLDNYDYAISLLQESDDLLDTYGKMDHEDVHQLYVAVCNKDTAHVNAVPSTRNIAFFYLDVIPLIDFSINSHVVIEEIDNENDDDWHQMDQIFKMSFAPEERRPIEALRENAREGRSDAWPTKCHFWVAKINGKVIALNIFEFVPQTGFTYLWFMANDTSWRGKGIGSLMFQKMWRHSIDEANKMGIHLKGIVFEVDSPDTDDLTEKKKNEKRIKFYEYQETVILPMDFTAPPFWKSPEHHEITYKLMVKIDDEEFIPDVDFVRSALLTILCESTLGYLEPIDTPYIERSLKTLTQFIPKSKPDRVRHLHS